jgi:hypothetical protein
LTRRVVSGSLEETRGFILNSIDEKRFITPKQAANMYGFSVGYLANLRLKRQGPAYYKPGKKVLYKVADFESWVTENPVKTIDQIAS